MGYIQTRGLINYIDSKAKCRHLKNWPVKGLCGRCWSEFIDWRYSPSCWYFRPSFLNFCPSNLRSGSTLPPSPPSLCEVYCIVYTRTQCVRGWEYGVLGLRQLNTCRKVPLQINIFRWRHYALPSMSLIFLRFKPCTALDKSSQFTFGQPKGYPMLWIALGISYTAISEKSPHAALRMDFLELRTSLWSQILQK